MNRGSLVLSMVLGALTSMTTLQAGAQSSRKSPAPRTQAAERPAASGTQSVAPSSGVDPAEEAPYVSEMKELRRQLLARATWADLGDRCNPGALRVFAGDTSKDAMADVTRLMSRMEDIIVLLGAGKPVDDPDGRALTRTIMLWEAGSDRPFWDVASGAPRRAFATGLTGDYPDPQSDKCLSAPRSSDTVTFVIPGLSDVDVKSPPPIRLKAFLGGDGVLHARNEFVSSHRNAADLTLEYVLLAPLVRWNEWAVVRVNRPLEDGGVEIGRKSNGGAVYLMHRVDGDWRLFGIARSWGR